jgi:hypothetical protein
MSDVKRYTPSMKVGHMVKDCDGLWVRSQDFNDAQSELTTLREELTDRAEELIAILARESLVEQRLAAAEQRNSLPADWADLLFAEMERRFELSKQYHQDHMVNDDTQIGIEFAIEWITAALTKLTELGASE